MPDTTDDIVEIPVAEPIPGDDGTPVLKDVQMDDDIKALMRQNFIMQNKRLDFYAESYLDQSRHVSTQSNQMFVANTQFVGSGALNRVPSGLPNQILDHNAAAGQPWASPSAPAPKQG